MMQGLIDRGLPPHVAAGIAGNFAVESGFDPNINERADMIGRYINTIESK